MFKKTNKLVKNVNISKNQLDKTFLFKEELPVSKTLCNVH